MVQAYGDNYAVQFVERRLKLGIRVKNIWPQGAPIPSVWKDHETQRRDVRFIEGLEPFQSGFIVHDDYVTIITSTKELFSIQIKSFDLARTMKFLFDIVWANALMAYKQK